ncbi:EAL domain-containing protein [Altererythrobacter fulvus]|uniref:EAL domain-containing protein n=1 Tax=Caenibius fulvus TaxID=2126012 RepID=UPI00301977D1
MRAISRLTLIIVLGVCVTTALPIFAAITLARHQETRSEERHALSLARNALFHSEISGDQLTAAARAINALPPDKACSPVGQALMRKIDLESTMLQAVGWVDGNVMRCSSFAGGQAFDLGPPDTVSRSDTRFRNHVTLIDPKQTYMVTQIGSAAGVLNRDLILSFVDDIPGLSVGIFSWTGRTTGAVRGPVPDIVRTPDLEAGRVYRIGDLHVAVVRSDKYDIGAFAALPVGNSTGYVNEIAGILIPLGVIVGLILSALLIHVIRVRASMPAMIRTALKQDKFHLLYQPVVDLANGQVVAAEALLRWDRGSGNPIPPDRFIAAAEEAGVIHLVTTRMLKLLSTDAHDVLRIAPEFRFSVNFSAQDMHRPGIVQEVTEMLERSGIACRNLVIEATERSLVDVERARETMRQFRAAGIRVAIDDFGTGYSSLGYLAQLEVDSLKIDRLFIQSLGTDAATSQVAGRIIDMARDLGLKTVAEGIETVEQERLLKGLKVDFGQGYLYGHPMPLEELLVLLRGQQAGEKRRLRLVAA